MRDIGSASPEGFLEPLWRINPHGRAGLGAIGLWAVLLLLVVGVACVVAAFGLWQGARGGYALAIVVLSINLLGDVTNVVLGTEPKAVIGIPIVVVILVYLASDRVRAFFRSCAENRVERSHKGM